MVPEGAALFPVDDGIDVGALVAELGREYDALAAADSDDPFHNPVLMLARRLSRRLDRDELSHSALEQAVQLLTAQAFSARAARLGRTMGETGARQNVVTLENLLGGLAKDDDGVLVPFETFRDKLSRELFGLVVTAHPTFNLPGALMTTLAELAVGTDADGMPLEASATEARRTLALTREHRPETMTLEREHDLSLVALANVRRALGRLYEAVFDVAERHYADFWGDRWPERLRELSPRLLTAASWVGYDFDGRSDVGWVDTFHKRLKDQAACLRATQEEVDALRALAVTEREPRLVVKALAALEDCVSEALARVTKAVDAFGGMLGEEPAAVRDRVQEIAPRVIDGASRRLSGDDGLTALLTRALECAESRALRRRLFVLRATLANTGFGMARVHVRLNASQLHNALRGAVALSGAPDDPRYRVSYLDRMNALLDEVQPVSINFGSILSERASAIRLFMVVAQMLKHVDPVTPVRFLIAECETAFTVLAALYLARLFGVADRVDISPLFETQRALEVGSRLIDQLLDNPHYRAYIEARGCLSVETGYSDAGRYIGQIPAAASIERFRLRLAAVLEKHGLAGVQLVVFDTHGESVGRGAHPAGFPERLDYVDSPATRRAFAEAGVDLKEEVSFQGGDGYLFFMTPDAALATVTRLIEHAFEVPEPQDDPFYAEADYIRETFTTMTEFQRRLMDDPDYGALLGAFAPEVMYPSGSRAVVRQREGVDGALIARAAELRAIPHNAALLQTGALSNSIGGLGAAIARDPERFVELHERSPRLRSLMRSAGYAWAIGSFEVLNAYIATFEPALWLVRAKDAADAPASSQGRSEQLWEVADVLARTDLHDRQNRVFRRLYRDGVLLRSALGRLSGDGVLGSGLVTLDTRRALALLHAIRVALIQEIFLLAVRVPDFSPQLGTSRDELVMRLFHLDVEGAVAVLENIFPAQVVDSAGAELYAEPASYEGEGGQTYRAEYAEIFAPLRNLHDLTRRISSAIVHHAGFFG